MSRLIPLVLKPVPITDSTPKTSREDRQRTAPISLFLRPSSPNTYQHSRGKKSPKPPLPVKSPRRRVPVAVPNRKSLEVTRSNSEPSLAVSTATTELGTALEEAEIVSFRETMDDVRRSYIKGNYKICSSLCIALLACSNTNGHSLHKIYLTFYLATSLELQSKNLPISERLSMLYNARSHYEATSTLVWSSLGTNRESFHSTASTAPTTPTSNRSSRAHSPTSSISSADYWPTSPKAAYLPTATIIAPATKITYTNNSINDTPKARPQLSLSIPDSRPHLGNLASHLRSLSKQLDHHISCINSEIKSLHTSPTSPVFRGGWLPGFTSSEMRVLERQVKMQQLKMTPRKRFDASRIKRLCDDALEELCT